MNESQTIFTLFFAISWGIVSNVLPRWRPFHYALCCHPRFYQPTVRIGMAFLFLNIIPWFLFIVVLVWLRGKPLKPSDWTFSTAFLLLIRSILPGIVPFGCYRLWIFLMQFRPNWFYAPSQEEIPKDFQVKDRNVENIPFEPDITITYPPVGAWKNLVFGLIYIAFFLLALIPQVALEQTDKG